MKNKEGEKKVAQYYTAGGGVVTISPANGKTFSYKELTEAVNGMVEIVPLPSGKILIGNEESKLTNSPIKNDKATDIWKQEYPIKTYAGNNDELICGDVIICEDSMVE